MFPSITVITPTTPDRAVMLNALCRMVDIQDYSGEIQHLVMDGPGTIGEKRNAACADATTDLIVCMDDDDAFGPDFISRSVQFLLDNRLDITGMSKAIFQSKDHQWLYEYKGGQAYLLESGMLFYKKHWAKYKFSETSNGEGLQMLRGKIRAHNIEGIFVAGIHESNTASHLALKNKEFTQIY